jgi:hypothetical protein
VAPPATPVVIIVGEACDSMDDCCPTCPSGRDLDSSVIAVPLAQAGYALYRFEEKGLRAYNPERDGETLIDHYASKRSVLGCS